MNSNLIQIDRDDYLKLVSAKLVLDVINKSIKQLDKDSNGENLNQNFNLLSLNENIFLKNTTDQQHASLAKFYSKKDCYVKNRKYFNQKRWHCIARPQYKYSCGISSLVSSWNYLYSNLGYGSLKPLTQEEAMNIFGFKPPYDEIRFGPFTGNVQLMKWFNQLNDHFSVRGRASFFYKPVGSNKTIGVNEKIAKERLENLLQSKSNAFVYHCYNHYCCPIGYEREPLDQKNVYENDEEPNELNSFTDWIFLAETSRKYSNFHCVKWEDINRDLNLKSPEYLNIRHLERGVMTREPSKKQTKNDTDKKLVEKNLHCLIRFEKIENDDVDFNNQNDLTKNIIPSSEITDNNLIDLENDDEELDDD